MKKEKLPVFYEKFNKMTGLELGKYIYDKYGYKLFVDGKTGHYVIFNLKGKYDLRCDSAGMLIYWLEIAEMD